MGMGFLMDGITISLCLLTVGYCYFLNRQIRGLRHSKSGIGSAIEQMNRCIGDLQGSFVQAKQAVEKQSEILHDRLDEGGSLADHMGVLVRQANRALVALESGIARSTKAKEEAIEERKRIESLLKDSSRLSVQAQADALLNTFFQKGSQALNMAQTISEEEDGVKQPDLMRRPDVPVFSPEVSEPQISTENLESVLAKKIATTKARKAAPKNNPSEEGTPSNQAKADAIAALLKEFPIIPAKDEDPLDDVMPKGLKELSRRS